MKICNLHACLLLILEDSYGIKDCLKMHKEKQHEKKSFQIKNAKNSFSTFKEQMANATNCLILSKKICLDPKNYKIRGACIPMSYFFFSNIACNDAVFERKPRSQWLTNQETRPSLEMADNFKNKRLQ